jgi:hypothetical protein
MIITTTITVVRTIVIIITIVIITIIVMEILAYIALNHVYCIYLFGHQLDQDE